MLVSALLKFEEASATPAIIIANGVFILPTVLSGSKIMSGREILATKQIIPKTIAIMAGEQSCFKTSFKDVFPLIIITPYVHAIMLNTAIYAVR